MKAETRKKPCVKFEERRLNTLRENRICQKVNLNVSKNATPARCPPGHHLFNNLIFSSKNLAKKGFLRCFHPIDQFIPFAYSCIVFLQYTPYINMACLIKGGKAVKMLKKYYKSSLVTNFVQTCSFNGMYIVCSYA